MKHGLPSLHNALPEEQVHATDFASFGIKVHGIAVSS
jgi:hypothetical protein